MMLAFWILFAVFLCAICSILETVLLSTRTLDLLGLSRHGARGAARLLEIRRGELGDAISAILIVNTLAGTIGPGFVGAEAARLWGGSAVGYASAGLTILLLIFAEIGPKTFAATHSVALAPSTGRILGAALVLMRPILPLSRALTRLFAGKTTTGMTRRQLAAFLTAAPSEGTITHEEAELLSSLVYAQEVTLAEVHTPAPLVFMVSADSPIGALLAAPESDAFSRVPVFRGEPAEVFGYVFVKEILRAVAEGAAPDQPLAPFARPLPRLASELTVRIATETLLAAHEAIGMVHDRAKGFIGIVTLEDLLEALLGIAITDEPEDLSALRTSPDIARQRRIIRLRQSRSTWNASGYSDRHTPPS